jgi:hypothetical protein
VSIADRFSTGPITCKTDSPLATTDGRTVFSAIFAVRGFRFEPGVVAIFGGVTLAPLGERLDPLTDLYHESYMRLVVEGTGRRAQGVVQYLSALTMGNLGVLDQLATAVTETP